MEAPSLERLLEPVTKCMTPEALRQLVNLPADPALQERMDYLADKNTENQLTPEEREEYETFVHAIQVVSILQSEARRLLASASPQ